MQTENLSHHPYYLRTLCEEFARRCERNPRYSLRAFARALQIDVAALSRCLSGKVLPSAKMADQMLSRLALPPENRGEFIESLAERHRASQSARLNPIFKKYGSVSSSHNSWRNPQPAQELSIDLFRTISDWYHFAILELTFTPDFQNDPKWIASQLDISPAEATLAIQRLKSLGLLEETNGKLKKTSEQLMTADRHLTTSAHRKRQEQILTKAIHSLEEDPIEVRNHSAMTMAIDPAKIPGAKKMIEEFTRKLCDYLEGPSSENSSSRTQVYELGVALFPLQKRNKSSTPKKSPARRKT